MGSSLAAQGPWGDIYSNGVTANIKLSPDAPSQVTVAAFFKRKVNRVVKERSPVKLLGDNETIDIIRTGSYREFSMPKELVNKVCDMKGDKWDVVDRAIDNTGNCFEVVLMHIDPKDDATILNVQVFDFVYQSGNTVGGWPAPVLVCSLKPENYVMSITQKYALIYCKEKNGDMKHEKVVREGIANTKEFEIAQKFEVEITRKLAQHVEASKGPFSAKASDTMDIGASSQTKFRQMVCCSFNQFSEDRHTFSFGKEEKGFVYQMEVLTHFYNGDSISGRGGVMTFDTPQNPIHVTPFPCPYLEMHPEERR